MIKQLIKYFNGSTVLTKTLFGVDGCIAFMDFESDTTESVGGTISTTAGTLTYANTPNSTKYLKFSGSGESIQTSISNTGSTTIAFWVYLPAAISGASPAGTGIILGHDTTDFGAGIFFGDVAGSYDGETVTLIAPGSYKCSWNTALASGWNLLVITYNPTPILYVNGGAASTLLYNDTPQTSFKVSNLLIGKRPYGNPIAANYGIDKLMVFNKSLTQAESLSIYTNSKATFGL